MSLRHRTGLLVILLACLVRLPHADVSWFGNDQINFVAEGRRIIAGDWNVQGPLASGFNILGPLYSFLVAGLLWIGGSAEFLTFANALCEVAAAWLVYDTVRRVSGPTAGIAAGVAYATAPMLMISTRLIWNPSLLPAAVALGFWLVVRYLELPSTWRLVSVALACGLCLTLHATGIFPSTAWLLIVLFGRRPSLKQLAVAVPFGMLPLTPLLFRWLTSAPAPARADVPIGLYGVLDSLAGIARLTVGFPLGAYGEHWSATPSTAVLCLEAALAAAGLVAGLLRNDRFRILWAGIALALGAHVTAAVVYSGHLAWYYFTGAVAPVCVCVGYAVGAWPRVRLAASVTVTALAVIHVVFVNAVDARAVEMGLLRFETARLRLRLPPGDATFGAMVRGVKQIADALRDTYPDAETAMRASHGVRAEFWRETGAESMSRATAPRDDWNSDFVLMGPGPSVVRSDARLAGARACVFDRQTRASWKVLPDDPPARWELPAFDDERWYPIEQPRRWSGSPPPGPSAPGGWRTPRQSLRGRVVIEEPGGSHLFVVSIHSPGNSQHWITMLAVNGTAIAPTKSRALQSSVYRNEEWLFDLSGRLRQGENLIAVGLDGQGPWFDIDVFELPCQDREWYNAEP